MHINKPSIRSNGVRFNQKVTIGEVTKNNIGTITIRGKFETIPGVDDPVIEIFNAVQLKMQTAIWNVNHKKLINFTPLFPVYDEKKDLTIYELLPSNHTGAPEKEFLAEAKMTLDICYKDLFIAYFRQFLEARNTICNRNVYALYKQCIEQIKAETDIKKRTGDIATTRLLIEDFINFLDLPLPRSKEELERQATLATLEEIKKSENLYAARLHTVNGDNVIGLLTDQDEFDELFAYTEE